MKITMQVQKGSVQDDAVVRIEVALNDFDKAVSRLDEAYQEGRAKLTGQIN